MAEREEVREFIAKLVQEHWTGTGKAKLLSQVGPKIWAAFPDSRFLMPKGLLRFLQGWATVQIIRHPQIPEKIGLVPLGVTLPSETSTLFSESQMPVGPLQPDQLTLANHAGAQQENERRALPRRSYLPEFWRAFHVPIEGQRFVTFPASNGGRPQIVDLPAGTAPEDKHYEITQADVSSSVGMLSDRVKATAQRIQNWLDRNELQADPFLSIATTKPSSLRSLTKHSSEPFTQDHRIAHAFSKLDPSDLARINVPLDIVLKLLASHRE
ncbi:hypothetical protein [Bradyrhizobium sp. AZCC 2230]|uniref:hypothetical protein n=1 Tax=Bradyrhizobium sp. AZCC 2230 TaxID=3117021 RepID=UPI002FF43BC9